jgi:hypothetical protein
MSQIERWTKCFVMLSIFSTSTKAAATSPGNGPKPKDPQEVAVEACKNDDFATAIPIFERLADDKEGMASRMFFAECLVKKKEWVRAIRLCDSVIERAQIIETSGAPTANVKVAQERAAWAHEVCDPIRKRIPKLQLIVSGEEDRQERLRVILDGKPLDPAHWKHPFPVDPGSHRVEPRVVAEGALPPTEVYARETPDEGITYPVYIHIPKAPEPYNLSNGLQKLGIGLTAVGTASVVASGVFFTIAALNYSDSDATGLCPDPATGNGRCEGEGYRLREFGYRNATLGAYFSIGGAGAIALGIVSITIGHKLEKNKLDDARKISLFMTPWGAGVVGSF